MKKLLSLPVHVEPSPVKPLLHVQLYPPSLLEHVANLLHSCVPLVHSSMSAKESGVCKYKQWGNIVSAVSKTLMVI